MRALIIPLVITTLAGCAGQAAQQDLFANREQFAAQRQLESVMVRDMDYQEACAHVTSVLMDLDCELKEINSELGIISAQGSHRWVAPAGLMQAGSHWSSCGGRTVTVSISDLGTDLYGVRATFVPPDPAADQAFRSLLRTSIQMQAEENADDQ